MAASAVAEQIDYTTQFYDPEEVYLATELASDVETRLQASRFIGSCLAREAVDLSYAEEAEHVQPIESLYDAILLAAEGDERARQMVAINVATDVVERTMKTAHITKTVLNIDEAGRIQQFGQSMESVQANSLRYASDTPQMLARTKAETTNAFRIAEYHRQGLLEDYAVVVFSRAADDMSEAAMREAGFFVDTMSTSIQVTTSDGETLITESAFVAGKRHPNSERHDAETIAGIGEHLGVDLTHKSATKLLETPVLVHKSVLPNGALDIVKLYDAIAGDTFFGEDKPIHDYFAYRDICKEREERFGPLVESITDKLVALAPVVVDRMDASEKLHKLAGYHMSKQAVYDTDINPLVFDEEAAGNIEKGRIAYQNGDYATAHFFANRAAITQRSSSCPSALKARENDLQQDQNGESSSSDETPGDCEFVSKQCPKCGEKNVKTIISKGKIKGSCGCSATLK